jgi:hypothetical protein
MYLMNIIYGTRKSIHENQTVLSLVMVELFVDGLLVLPYFLTLALGTSF